MAWCLPAIRARSVKTNDFFIFPLRIFYVPSGQMKSATDSMGRAGKQMATYRTCRPMVVEATQCSNAETVTTDLGFVHIKRGEWVISGEDGECYVVDDAFFKRTFVSVQEPGWNPEPPAR
jgi:hypothetical protein